MSIPTFVPTLYPEDKTVVSGAAWRLVESEGGHYLQLVALVDGQPLIINVGLFVHGPEDKARAEIARYIRESEAMARHAAREMQE